MITYLKVKNLAIVEEFAIEPGPAFNVLTGETGAGKSLLIDSLDFLSGARGDTESIRGGAERMSAEGVFAVSRELAEPLMDAGIEIDPTEDGIELIVRRELMASGRGRVLMNGSPVSVRELSGTLERVVEIHGQHESHHRIAGQSFRELLDDYAENAAGLDATRAAWDLWKYQSQELDRIRGAQRDRALRIDLLKYQIEEIRAGRLELGEEDQLRDERLLLSHAAEMAEATAGAYALLEEDESSALAQLARARNLMQSLAGKIPSVAELQKELDEARFRLQETARSLSSLGSSTRHDPARLEAVEERLSLIERLRKKYGGTVEAVLAHLEASSREFDELADYEASLEKLERAEASAFEDYRGAAEALSAARREAAKHFQSAIRNELNDLAMEGTAISVTMGCASLGDSRLVRDGQPVAFGPEGFDRVEILVAPNRGEEPKPMQRIASGGELSRIQLAIAAALFKSSERGSGATLVFDEIDAGIGGRVAEVVGRKLRELAENNQVICVTHLPQIASLAQTHFRVWKEEHQGKTRARIARLDSAAERVEEVARMLGGESITESARAHARELLGAAVPQRQRRRRATEGGAPP
jgi:DNA repair protein RecN (Recombination protein N)